jgi:hypothetical protein
MVTPISNRKRRLIRKARPVKPRDGERAGEVRASAEVVEIPLDRDGMLWLINRNRLNPGQVKQARAYRADFRDAEASGPNLRSCLNITEGGVGSRASDGPGTQVIRNLDAQRRLFVSRFVILRGQADLLEVLDAVCGRGLTLRDLAGGRTPQAMVLEKLLKVALDQLVQGALDEKYRITTLEPQSSELRPDTGTQRRAGAR